MIYSTTKYYLSKEETDKLVDFIAQEFGIKRTTISSIMAKPNSLTEIETVNKFVEEKFRKFVDEHNKQYQN